MNKTICPVPKEQIPINEYTSIYNSWFFSWPLQSTSNFNFRLVISWIIMLPFCILISYGSVTLKENISNLLLTSALESFILPLLILIRQLISWKYIFNRLISDRIEYEETGWYDGKTWLKTEEFKNKDMLVASLEVKPIINLLVKTIMYTTLMLLLFLYCILTISTSN